MATGNDLGSSPITAALTLSLTGPFARQGTEATEGLRLWADGAGIRLILVDDGGSRLAAVEAYAQWLDGVDLLIGPYSSGLVRAVAPLVRGKGRLLWNHGGSADDLAGPGVVALPAPASSYFDGAVDEAVARGVDWLVIVRGNGPFARAVAEGATTRASRLGLDTRTIGASALTAAHAAGVARLARPRSERSSGRRTAASRRMGTAATSSTTLKRKPRRSKRSFTDHADPDNQYAGSMLTRPSALRARTCRVRKGVHAARRYSCRRPPSRSRRWILPCWSSPTTVSPAGGSGACSASARCGRCRL
jgi:Periplasmic binding protein